MFPAALKQHVHTMQNHALPCTGTVHTPRSPFHAAAPTGLEASGGFGSALQQQQQGQQPPQLARSGSADSSGHGGQQGSAWAAQGSDNLTLNLPSELGLGDSSAMADEEVLRVHNMATARQQQQQGNSASHSRPLTIRTTGAQHSIASSSLPNFAGILSSYGGEGSAGSPLGGPRLNSEGSGGFLGMAGGAAASGSSRFAAPGGFGSDGFPGSPHSLGLVPPPPPPPPQAPPGMLADTLQPCCVVEKEFFVLTIIVHKGSLTSHRYCRNPKQHESEFLVCCPPALIHTT